MTEIPDSHAQASTSDPSVASSLGRASDLIDDVVRRQKAGEALGVASICSAHPLALEAAVLQASEGGGPVLIEATSNQVDQTGGYTGMRPRDFRDLVLKIADRCGLPRERIVLGGDHLGPNRWRQQPHEQAMLHAEELVSAYVSAGFTKIHLDCSFPCAGEHAPLSDVVVSQRTARLVAVAEGAAAQHGFGKRMRYVIGTEVPAPGGEREGAGAPAPTSAASALETLRLQRDALAAHGLGEVWPRVVALVVQPGVDFDQMRVFDYRRESTAALRHALDAEPGMVFEAHSTDYQTRAGLRALVEDHWAILKVGPALTFALREALFALATIETELIADAERSRLLELIDERMLADPSHWRDYYTGDERQQRVARRYGYSDRLRYYWPDPSIAEAQAHLFGNLEASGIPLPLLSQHLPRQHDRLRSQQLSGAPRALVVDRVRDVLRDYAYACQAHA